MGHIITRIRRVGRRANAELTMTAMQWARFESPPHEELLLAATQQMQITERRLAAHFNKPSATQQEASPKGAILNLPFD